MKKIYITKSEKETKDLGESFAKRIKSGAVVGLKGDLGGGKTTFVQGLAKGLKIKDKILSPTFVILKRFGNFYHIDCYRLRDENDLLELGFKEIVSDKKNIVLIEWPERVEKIMPKSAIYIDFEFVDENNRKITINSNE